MLFNHYTINNYSFLDKNFTKDSDTIPSIYEPFSRLTPDLNEYRWPTDASHKITSSFAEYRPTHFHAGIDISTNLREGFKVLASRSGYVARIQILPNGYGKMLYLRHPDGYYTAYSHLKDFSEKIKTVLYKEQIKKQTYFVDFWLDSMLIQIKQGEIIAYTGGTGVGPPHLHFEILDENLNPVNPVLFKNLKSEDNIPPTIKKLYIAPADEYSSVFRKDDHYFLNIQSKTSNFYIKKPFPVNGKIKFGIETKDHGNEFSSKTGVYQIQLYLNDSLIYHLQYDRLPSEFTNQILLHYDISLLQKKKGKFRKLYVEYGNKLPIYNQLPYGSGIIDCSKLSKTINSFKIVVSDFSRNKSTISGSLIVDKTPLIQLLSVTDSLIKLQIENINKLKNIIVEGRTHHNKDIKKYKFEKRNFEISDSIVTIQLDTKRYIHIKIWGISENNETTKTVIYNTNNREIDDISVYQEIYKNKLKCIINLKQPYLSNLQIILVEGNQNRIIPLKHWEENKYIGYIEPDPSHKGPREIKVINLKNYRTIKTTGKFFVYPIRANISGTFDIDNKNILINYDSNSVYEDFIITIDSVMEHGKKIYKFYPQDIPLKKGIEILARRISDLDNIYFSKNGKWSIQKYDVDHHSNYLKAKFTRTLTDVALLKDTIPPWIGNLNIKKSGKRSSILLKFKDNLSGIDYNRIKFYINNELVIPEIDEEKKIIKYELETNNLKDINTLGVEISDKAGNIGKLIEYFKTQYKVINKDAKVRKDI